MIKKKGLLAIFLVLCLLAAGCSKNESVSESSAASKNASVPVQTDTSPAETSVSERSSDDQGQPEQNPEAEIGGGKSVSGYPAFDFERKTVTLNSGYEMPILGLGMFSLSDSQAENSTYWALKAGFRLIDTARIYGNEAAVGRGLQRAIDEGIVTREEVFITTKMWTSDFSNGDAAVDASLQRLGVDYIDIYYLHRMSGVPVEKVAEVMGKLIDDGMIRGWGLSQVDVDIIDRHSR